MTIARRYWICFSILVLAVTLARIAYSGWLSPLTIFQMRGDGIRGIFSGVDGYFLPGPLREWTTMILSHPYLSVTFYYSIFHSLCMTNFLGVALSAAAHLSMIAVMLLSLGIFDLSRRKKLFVLGLFVLIFSWAAFYDGVLQGFPPEFMEVLGIMLTFYLLLKGRPVAAGIALGFSSTIKILPAVFLVYFLYKRQFRLVISAVVTGLILTAVILWRENFSLNLLISILGPMGVGGAYGHSARDPGLNAFVDFVFRYTLDPGALMKIHYAACFFLAALFVAIERHIRSAKDQYFFGLAAVSLAMFKISPHISEMFWYILVLPAMIFSLWMLIRYPDLIFGAAFVFSYVFMHGFSLLNMLFKCGSDMYLYFNEHGGVFIGIWLLYFTVYGMALKYLVNKKKD